MLEGAGLGGLNVPDVGVNNQPILALHLLLLETSIVETDSLQDLIMELMDIVVDESLVMLGSIDRQERASDQVLQSKIEFYFVNNLQLVIFGERHALHAVVGQLVSLHDLLPVLHTEPSSQPLELLI